MISPVTLLVAMLRFGGCVLCLAAAALFLPRDTMAATNAWLGLEALPDAPLVYYLARSTSGLYALRGVSYFLAASDPIRYRPLIVLIGVTNVAFGIALGWIGVSEGMPAWWTAVECPFVVGTGTIVLLLVRAVPRERR
jgi:hypothetical protein